MAKTNLEVSIKEMQKKFGMVIAKGSECKALKIHKIPTGSYIADYKLKGGFPRRRLVEIYSPEHTGKSFWIYKIISTNQKRCRNCEKSLEICECENKDPYRILLLDYEEGYIGEWINICGVDKENLTVTTPSTWEDGIDMIEFAIKENLFDIIIVDSLTQASPTFVLNRDSVDPTMGVKPKVNAVFCSKVLSAFSPEDITNEEDGKKPLVLFTQQVRDQLGTIGTYSPPPKPTGGWSLKHNKHISIGLKNKMLLDEKGNERKAGKEVCGKKIIGRIYKDKIEGEYLTEFEFDFYFKDILNEDLRIKKGEIDNIKEIIDIAVIEGIIEQAGAWYKIPNVENKISGKSNLRIFLSEQKEIYEEIKKQVEKIIYG